MGKERNQREQAKECWGGAQNGQGRPLALRLNAQVRSRFFQGDLQLPTQHEPLDDLRRGGGQCGAAQSLRGELAQRITEQDPAQGDDGQAGVIPDSCATHQFDRALEVAIAGHGDRLPRCGRVVAAVRQAGLASTFLARRTALAWLPFRRRVVERRIGECKLTCVNGVTPVEW